MQTRIHMHHIVFKMLLFGFGNVLSLIEHMQLGTSVNMFSLKAQIIIGHTIENSWKSLKSPLCKSDDNRPQWCS